MALLFQEPFESISAWTVSGTPANWVIVAGRTANCVQTTSNSDDLWRAFGTGGASATVGFAFQVSANVGIRQLATFQSGTFPGTSQVTLALETTGALKVLRGGSFGTLLGTSATGLIALNTWYFVELQATLSDTVGSVEVKLNGTTVIGPLTGVDTNAGVQTTFDTLVLSAFGAGTVTKYDDLYLRNDATFGTVTPPAVSPWTWRPFVVRRTTGGDVLRASGGYRGALRYGPGVVTPEEVAGTGLLVYPRFYDSMVITVQVPATIAWEQAVLVRGGFGAPTTPQDGVPLWYLAEGLPHPDEGLSQQVIDTPLTPGNFYYYSLFLWIEGQWVLAYSQDNAVPAEHGWPEFMFNTLPMFYQRTDDMQAADGRNGPLRTFARALGYELDYTNTLANGVRDVYNVDKAPSRLLKYLGYNFGVPDEPVLGEARQRSMLQQLSDLNGLRGTTIGLKQLIVAATHYQCDVVVGSNQMLSMDDGDFNGGDVSQPGMAPLLGNDLKWGVGHWQPMTNATVLAKMEDPSNAGVFASSHTVTTAIVAKNTNTDVRLTPPGGQGAMVVNGSGPDIVVSCGPVLQNDSALYAIPVTPGALYSFSCQVMRTIWAEPAPATTPPPQARVVLAILWFDAIGAFKGASTGPEPPALNDLGVWQSITLPAPAPVTPSATYDAHFAIPAIWWVGSSAWAQNSTTPAVRPVNGRYVSMASFLRSAAAGEAVAAIGPDVFMTLGVTDKKLNDPAKSKLGIPERET